jgi:hypothetical protein
VIAGSGSGNVPALDPDPKSDPKFEKTAHANKWSELTAVQNDIRAIFKSRIRVQGNHNLIYVQSSIGVASEKRLGETLTFCIKKAACKFIFIAYKILRRELWRCRIKHQTGANFVCLPDISGLNFTQYFATVFRTTKFFQYLQIL